MEDKLTPTNAEFFDEAIARGVFADRHEALNAAVELLRKQRMLIEDVNAGLAQIARGETVPGDEALARWRHKARLLRECAARSEG